MQKNPQHFPSFSARVISRECEVGLRGLQVKVSRFFNSYGAAGKSAKLKLGIFLFFGGFQNKEFLIHFLWGGWGVSSPKTRLR